MSDAQSNRRLFDLLTRWQAFSELQQRAFAFLAAEALASGQEFENSTNGAAGLLMRIGEIADKGGDESVRTQTFAVVERLQAADRSRQGLEQVASVLNTLKTQHANLVTATHAVADLPEVEAMIEQWIGALAGTVNLADWRRRLNDALHGRAPSAAIICEDEDELF